MRDFLLRFNWRLKLIPPGVFNKGCQICLFLLLFTGGSNVNELLTSTHLCIQGDCLWVAGLRETTMFPAST